MKYELQAIDAMVTKTLHPDNYNAVQFSAKRAKECISSLEQEESRIKEVWKTNVFSFSDIEAGKLYVQNHQSAIIFLANELHNYYNSDIQKKGKANHLQDEVNDKAELTLVNLLYFIEAYFTHYFDRNAIAPIAYLLIARKDLKAQLKKFEQTLTQKNISDLLLTSFIISFEKMMMPGQSSSVTFGQIICLKELLQQFLRPSFLGSENINQSIQETLLHLNCNFPSVVITYKIILAEELNALETDEEKKNRLQGWYQEILHIAPRTGMALHPEWPSVQEWMLIWVDEEIGRLKKFVVPPKIDKIQADGSDSGPRAKSILTVPQLGLFMWLVFETGLLTYSTKTILVRKVIALVATKRADPISFRHLVNGFYSKDPADIKVVKHALIKMVNELNKM